MNKKLGLVMVYETAKIKHAFDNIKSCLTSNSIEFYSFNSTTEFAKFQLKLDCAIVVGGDGSILALAETAAKKQVPLIGIHRGNLGFLSDIDPESCQDLLSIISGELSSETRMMLEITINGAKEKFLALNEFAMNRKDDVHLLYYHILVDGALMYAQRSDGVVLHTPTGSTAYALSAGGPIVQPQVHGIGIVPLNPHRLNTRPIIIKDNQEIEIILPRPQSVVLSCDGRKIANSEVNTISIKKSPEFLTLLHPSDYDYFKVLRTKLGWEH